MDNSLHKQLEKFHSEMEDKVYGGLLIFLPNSKEFFRVSYGTGDNLLDEDKANGYDDYIYIQIDKFDDYWKEDVDGAQMMLSMQKDWNGHYNICQHVVDALEFVYNSVPENAIILQTFEH